MRWIQDNPFLAGLAAVTVAGVAALIFLLTQSLALYQQTSEQYVQAVQKLHGLQDRSPFPSKENFDQSKALAGQYKNELNVLRDQLAKMELPLNPEIKPQQFQDDLRAIVNQTTEKAAAAGVILPKDFYLGFGQYANSQPSERSAPALDRQLAVITKVVLGLIDLKVQSIDSLERRLLPEEAPAAAAGAQKKAEILERYLFDLTFTAEQAKFRVAFNSLVNSDQFLLIRGLSIQNSNPAGPLIVQADKNSAAAPGLTTGRSISPEGKANDLNVILGQELVKATLRIEILDFAEPVEVKK